MADIEMKAPDAEAKDNKTDAAEKTALPLTPVAEIKANAVLIEKAVTTLESRFINRVLRTLTTLRKRLDGKVLRDSVNEIYPKGPLDLVMIINTHLMC
jgi:26S proteasome regulatory subunit N3